MIDELSLSSSSSDIINGVLSFHLNLKREIGVMQREIKRRFNQE